MLFLGNTKTLFVSADFILLKTLSQSPASFQITYKKTDSRKIFLENNVSILKRAQQTHTEEMLVSF